MGDRGLVFLGKAGSVILLISLAMWAMATYPKAPLELLGARQGGERAALALEHSLAGRLGRAIEPVFHPLGFDWRMDVGVLTSFAARETFVSTLAVVYGVDRDTAGASLRETLRSRRRPDGMPLLGLATALPLLVFYVLAMQCLPTQAVTRRETGSWRWAAFQLGYMTVLAYTAALATRIMLRSIGIA
jgi:ferrous iron transport protein B